MGNMPRLRVKELEDNIRAIYPNFGHAKFSALGGKLTGYEIGRWDSSAMDAANHIASGCTYREALDAAWNEIKPKKR